MMRLHNEALTHREEHGMVRHEADTTVGRVLQGALGNENVLGTLGMVPNCGAQIKDGPHEVSSSWDVIAWTIKGHPNQVWDTMVLWCLHTLTHQYVLICTNLFELSPLMSLIWTATHCHLEPGSHCPWKYRHRGSWGGAAFGCPGVERQGFSWIFYAFYDYHWFSIKFHVRIIFVPFFGITTITTPERHRNSLLCGGELDRNV